MTATASTDLSAAVRAARLQRIARARVDLPTFAELVLKDETTGRAVTLAPFHLEWQQRIDESKRLVLLAPVEHGKTQTLVCRILWTLATRPDARILVVSGSFA